MSHILLNKREPFFIITKLITQHPNIKAQASDEFQPLEDYEKNTTIILDDMLLSKQENNSDLFLILRN